MWPTLLIPASSTVAVHQLEPFLFLFFPMGTKNNFRNLPTVLSQQQLTADREYPRRRLLAICGLLH